MIQQRAYEQFSEGCALVVQLERAIIESESCFERETLMGAHDFLSWHVSHALDREPVCSDLLDKLAHGIKYARDVLDWLARGGIGLLIDEGTSA